MITKTTLSNGGIRYAKSIFEKMLLRTNSYTKIVGSEKNNRTTIPNIYAERVYSILFKPEVSDNAVLKCEQ